MSQAYSQAATKAFLYMGYEEPRQNQKGDFRANLDPLAWVCLTELLYDSARSKTNQIEADKIKAQGV